MKVPVLFMCPEKASIVTYLANLKQIACEAQLESNFFLRYGVLAIMAGIFTQSQIIGLWLFCRVSLKNGQNCPG